MWWFTLSSGCEVIKGCYRNNKQSFTYCCREVAGSKIQISSYKINCGLNKSAWLLTIDYWGSNNDYFLGGIVSHSCWNNIDLVLKFLERSLERYKIGKMSNNINNHTFRLYNLVQTILFYEIIICSRKTYLIKCNIENFKLHYRHSGIKKTQSH